MYFVFTATLTFVNINWFIVSGYVWVKVNVCGKIEEISSQR